jgi:hypothetical protein
VEPLGRRCTEALFILKTIVIRIKNEAAYIELGVWGSVATGIPTGS